MRVSSGSYRLLGAHFGQRHVLGCELKEALYEFKDTYSDWLEDTERSSYTRDEDGCILRNMADRLEKVLGEQLGKLESILERNRVKHVLGGFVSKGKGKALSTKRQPRRAHAQHTTQMRGIR